MFLETPESKEWNHANTLAALSLSRYFYKHIIWHFKWVWHFLSWLNRTDGLFSFVISSYFPFVPLLLLPLFPIWTNLCDSYALTSTVLLWLILWYLSYVLKAVRWLTDLLCDSPLFVSVYYRLCVFNYKYHVVAVVRPLSCLSLFLAIHCIPLNFCLTWIAMPSSRTPNHRITEPLHTQHHSHIKHTKTLQGLDTSKYYKDGSSEPSTSFECHLEIQVIIGWKLWPILLLRCPGQFHEHVIIFRSALTLPNTSRYISAEVLTHATGCTPLLSTIWECRSSLWENIQPTFLLRHLK